MQPEVAAFQPWVIGFLCRIVLLFFHHIRIEVYIMSFQENLRLARKSKQLSQEELAELLDVSRQAVSKWEQGICMPEAQMLMQISEKLEISLDKLMLDSADAQNNELETDPSYNTTNGEISSGRHKKKTTIALVVMASVVLCIAVIVVLQALKKEAVSVSLSPTDNPSVESTYQAQQPATQNEENAPAEVSEDNSVFTTKQDRERLYELSADFANAYFAQDVDTIASFLSPFFVGDPKDVSPWAGIDTFTVKGVDSILTEKPDGTKIISIEFRSPDYPDSFLYLTIIFAKENEEWSVQSYYLEQ